MINKQEWPVCTQFCATCSGGNSKKKQYLLLKNFEFACEKKTRALTVVRPVDITGGHGV